MIFYILEENSTGRAGGQYEKTVFDSLDGAVSAYLALESGYAVIVEYDYETKAKRILTDAQGLKYAKGSPHYDFPHISHTSRVDGTPIPTT